MNFTVNKLNLFFGEILEIEKNSVYFTDAQHRRCWRKKKLRWKDLQNFFHIKKYLRIVVFISEKKICIHFTV